MVGADYKPSLGLEGGQWRRILDVRLTASSDGVRAGSGNRTDFPGLWFECLCDISEWPIQQIA